MLTAEKMRSIHTMTWVGLIKDVTNDILKGTSPNINIITINFFLTSLTRIQQANGSSEDFRYQRRKTPQDVQSKHASQDIR